MDTSPLVIAIAILVFMPALCALGASAFYMLRYVRLRLSRKNTWADHLHDFAGSWTRLLMRSDPPAEQRCLRNALVAGACFVAYVSLLMGIGTIVR